MNRALALCLLAALALPASAAAHGIGGIRDLPVPGWLFLVGGATVLVVSFVALGALWTKPKLEVGAGRPLPEGLQRFLLSPYLRVVVSGLSLALFVVIWTAAAFGSERASANLAPTFIYITFWVGMVVVSIVLGNVWSVLDPWRAAADAVAWCARKAGWSREARPYPAGLGLWPAVAPALLVRGARARVRGPVGAAHARDRDRHLQRRDVDGDGDLRPRSSGGRTATGSPCTSASSRASRSSAAGGTRTAGRSSILRRPLSELARTEARPGAVAFLAVMLGSVAFDGLSRSSWWFERLYNIEIKFSNPESAERAVMLLNLSALFLAIVDRGDGLHGLGEDRGGRRRPARGVPGHLRREPDPDRDRVRAVPLPLDRHRDPPVRDPAALRPVRARAGISSARPASSRISPS